MIARRHVLVGFGVVALCTGATAYAGSDGAAALIAETWARYRSVNTEREESEILIVSGPPVDYSRADAEAMVREPRSGVLQKRAVRHVLYAANGQDKIHLLFSLPPDDAGLGLLVWRQAGRTRDDMWLFMPGYRAVRRIPISSKQRLAGTDLLYEDVRELAGERTDRFTYESIGTEPAGGRTAEVIRATPRSDTVTAYASRTIWIDKEWLFPLKVEFYDPAGKLWKVLRNAEIHEVASGVRRADLAEMCDVQLDQCTLLLVTRRSVAVEIPPQVFTEDYLLHPGAD